MKKLAVLGIAGLMTLSFASTSAFAFGKPATGADQSNALLDTALNLAILYGKADPKIGVVLTALGINSAEDLKKLLSGDKSGANLGNIISYAITNYAAQNPKIQAVLDQLGVKDFSDILNLLNGAGDHSALFGLAYDYVSHNEKYSKWLSTLGISNAADLSALFQGGIQGGNLQDLLFRIGMAYLVKQGKVNIGDLFAGANLGSFQGLPTTEVARIVKASKAARKK